MNCMKLATPIFGILSFALFVAALPAQAGQCSNANVSGSYGYTTSGFVAIPTGAFVRVAAAGQNRFRPAGKCQRNPNSCGSGELPG